jgi:hypothetical protein
MGPVFDREIEEIGMSLRGLVGADEAGEFVAPDDVRRLVSEEGWGTEFRVTDGLLAGSRPQPSPHAC